MLKQDMLDTLKKHLRDIEGAEFDIKDTKQSKSKILKFGEDIKSANELIGALQTLDITLKKIIFEAKKVDLQSNIQLDCIVFNIQQLIENCSFMGVGLFDATMSTIFNNIEIEFEITSPMNFVLKNNFEDAIQYLEDKREEIKEKLLLISQKISDNNQTEDSHTMQYDFSKSFEAKDFLKMF